MHGGGFSASGEAAHGRPAGAEGEVPSPMGRTAFPFRVETARPPTGQAIGIPPTRGGTGDVPLCGTGMHPPFSLVAPKKTGRAGSKRKTLFPCEIDPFGVNFAQRGSSESVLPILGSLLPARAGHGTDFGSAVPAAGACAESKCLLKGPCFSFRAPRFAQRWPGGRGPQAIAREPIPPQPPGQRQRKEEYTKSVLHPKFAIPGRGRRAFNTARKPNLPQAPGQRQRKEE